MGPPEDARVAVPMRLTDHAPLFPPALLDLPDALEEDRRARAHPASFSCSFFEPVEEREALGMRSL